MPLRLSVFFVYFYEALLATHVNSYMHRPSAQRSGGSLSHWRTCQIPALSLLCPCGFKRNSLLFQHSNGDLSIGVHDIASQLTGLGKGISWRPPVYSLLQPVSGPVVYIRLISTSLGSIDCVINLVRCH